MNPGFYGAFSERQEYCGNGFEIIWAGRRECGVNYAAEHSGGHYFLKYVLEGECLCKAPDGGETALVKGDIALFRPDERMLFQANADNQPSFAAACFGGKVIDPIIKPLKLYSQKQFSYGVSEALVSLFDGLAYAIAVKRGGVYALGILLEIMGKIESGISAGGGAGEGDSLRKALDYMLTNYNKKLTLDDIAQVSGYSASRFQYLFTKRYGESVMDYLIRERIKKAAQLLRHELTAISEIASAVGFRDPYYFSKMFKKVMGMSPREWRKEAIG